MPRIKHFIVLMLENRSFDHLLGFFPPPAGETVENLQAIFGLNGLLNHRDESARMLSLLSGGLESVEEPPATQGEAAAAIEAKLEAAGL